MREIKFRAWDGKKMLENVGVMNGNACIWKPAPKNSAEFTVVVNGETHFGYSDWDVIVERPEFILMQFTGLRDKNGKEIYEGDIVGEKDVWWEPVTFDQGCFCIGLEPLGYQFEEGSTDLEVLGNICENPELNKQPAFDDSLPYFQDD